MLDGRVRRSVDSRDNVAHALEIRGHRSQFGGVAVMQSLGKPYGKANARPLGYPPEFAQPGPGQTVPELRCGLQANHFSRELSIGSGSFGR
jgi:hypothetical protein